MWWMPTALLCLLMGAVLRAEVGAGQMSPDGVFYLRAPRLRPYCLRPLMPATLRGDLGAWRRQAWISTICTVGLLWSIHPLAGALFLGLAIVRTNLWFPVLVDAHSLFMMTLVAYFVEPRAPLWYYMVPVGMLLAFYNEKAWIFAALFTLNPWLAVGGAPVSAFLYWRGKAPEERVHPVWLTHPLQAAWSAEKLQEWLDPRAMILPWGLALLGLFHLPFYLVAAAYAQCLFAQDRARLYQWIAPFACVAAAHTGIPSQYWAPLVILHFMNPWRRVL